MKASDLLELHDKINEYLPQSQIIMERQDWKNEDKLQFVIIINMDMDKVSKIMKEFKKDYWNKNKSRFEGIELKYE